jgi:lipoprotein-releasing system ATP-binding protein
VTRGIIRVDDVEVSSLEEEKLTVFRNKVVGYIFQFHYLLKDFTALENVMMPAYIGGMKKSQALRCAEDLLKQVGLKERFDHFPSQLSGGERQRVAVARALVNDPALLLADEPTGNLDENNSRNVEDILFTLVKEHGKTLILVTHDNSLASRGSVHKHLEKGVLT